MSSETVIIIIIIIIIIIRVFFLRKRVLNILFTFNLSDAPSNISVLSYLCPFVKLLNSLLVSSCLSVCPHGTIRLPLDDFHEV